jgi:hypothetical protein
MLARQSWYTMVCLCVATAVFLTAGCGPALVAGGAAAGYGVAKDAEDGKIIDD